MGISEYFSYRTDRRLDDGCSVNGAVIGFDVMNHFSFAFHAVRERSAVLKTDVATSTTTTTAAVTNMNKNNNKSQAK